MLLLLFLLLRTNHPNFFFLFDGIAALGQDLVSLILLELVGGSQS